jgi:small GTP-binding protein
VKVALVGQPNSGKSTLFNAVAGYRSLTSNFAGTTVEYTHGQARVGGQVLELIDLPGLYSLTPTSAVEEVSRDYLMGGAWDVIVNVLDASQLARSLELTLELLDLESPMVVCLNMMDEAARKGMTIDTHALGAALGVPVVEAIGARGRGIIETFRAAQQAATAGNHPRAFIYAPDVEGTVEELAEKIAASADGQPVAIPTEAGVGMAEPGARSDLRTPMGSTGLRKSESRESGHPPSLDSAAFSCAVGQCSSACCGHPPAMEDRQGTRATAAVAVLAAQPPLIVPPTNFPATPFQSPIANHKSQILAFPPARFRALQLVQSKPRHIPMLKGAADPGHRPVDAGRRTLVGGVGAGGNRRAHGAACRRGGLRGAACGLPDAL